MIPFCDNFKTIFCPLWRVTDFGILGIQKKLLLFTTSLTSEAAMTPFLMRHTVDSKTFFFFKTKLIAQIQCVFTANYDFLVPLTVTRSHSCFPTQQSSNNDWDSGFSSHTGLYSRPVLLHSFSVMILSFSPSSPPRELTFEDPKRCQLSKSSISTLSDSYFFP